MPGEAGRTVLLIGGNPESGLLNASMAVTGMQTAGGNVQVDGVWLTEKLVTQQREHALGVGAQILDTIAIESAARIIIDCRLKKEPFWADNSSTSKEGVRGDLYGVVIGDILSSAGVVVLSGDDAALRSAEIMFETLTAYSFEG